MKCYKVYSQTAVELEINNAEIVGKFLDSWKIFRYLEIKKFISK